MNAEEGIIAGLGAGVMIIYLAILLLTIISLWKIFTKAGKPGWAAIIPIYNAIVILQIIGKPLWWIVLFLIPIVNVIFSIWATNLLAKSFGKSEGFTVGMIFLPFIFYPILGFGSAEYQGPSAAEAQNHNDSLDA
ncbi:DUF5684 domain-containing protein [Halocola ammonii]